MASPWRHADCFWWVSSPKYAWKWFTGWAAPPPSQGLRRSWLAYCSQGPSCHTLEDRHDIRFPPVFEYFFSCLDQRLSRVALQWHLPASSAFMGAMWGKKALSTSAFSISCVTRSPTSFSSGPTFSVGYLLTLTYLKELSMFFGIPGQIEFHLGFSFPNFTPQCLMSLHPPRLLILASFVMQQKEAAIKDNPFTP